MHSDVQPGAVTGPKVIQQGFHGGGSLSRAERSKGQGRDRRMYTTEAVVVFHNADLSEPHAEHVGYGRMPGPMDGGSPLVQGGARHGWSAYSAHLRPCRPAAAMAWPRVVPQVRHLRVVCSAASRG